MAVKIRLRRVGAKKQPAYRVVIADARAPRDGRFIEVVGHYNPLTHPSTVVIDSERAMHWLRQGAQPTEIVQKLLVVSGVWSQYTGEPMPEPVAVPVVEEAAPIDADAEPVEMTETAEATPAEEPVAETAPEEPVAEEPAVETAPEAPATEKAAEEPAAE